MILIIDIDMLKEKILNIQKLVDSYEIANKNIYSNIYNISNYWKVPVSHLFFSKVEEYRNNNMEILSIKNIISLFNIIVNKYENSYKAIYYNSEFDNKTEEQLQSVLESLSNISNSYNNLYAPGYGGEIATENNNIIKSINNINSVIKNFSTTIEMMRKKELEIETEVSKTEIFKLSDFDELEYILNYKTTEAQETYVDLISLENETQKLIFNLQNQTDIINDIKKQFIELKKYYNSNNTNNIQELMDTESTNFQIISDNFDKYLKILNDAIEKNNELKSILQDKYNTNITIDTDIKRIQ